MARLRVVPLFERLSDDDLDRLDAVSETVTLEPGAVLFEEGSRADRAFVITDGEVEIVKRSGSREVVLTVRRTGEVIGEMALLQESRRSAAARAKTRAELIAIPKAALDSLLDRSPAALRGLFEVLMGRWMATESYLRQNARMAQLGTLTAGIAHEINNPAAAARRVTALLPDVVDRLGRTDERLLAGLPVEEARRFTATRAEIVHGHGDPETDPLDRADTQDALAATLRANGVDDPDGVARVMVEHGLTADDVRRLASVAGDRAGRLFESLEARLTAASLIAELDMAMQRIAGIVDALKSYTYLDRAPVLDIDVARGIRDTVTILSAKLRDIDVTIETDDALPSIEAYGGELNQVWTNLLDNAADAVIESGRADGAIVVRISHDEDRIVVEVEDNGIGIGADDRERVFDAFFTSKPPGAGTGLGLKIAHDIVTDRHGGSIGFDSEPGHTVFRVELPRRLVR